MTIFGWDASHYDWDRGSVDVAAARRDGILFATHKVSEGVGYADPRFDDFAAKARAAGMSLIGGYCVNLRGDQRPQVDQFIRRLDSAAPWWRDGDFLVQLDCERWSDKDGVYAYEPRLAEIRAWCSYFMQRTGGRWTPIVYAPKWVYGDSLRGLEYPLWASAYGDNPAVGYRSAYPGDTSSRWGGYSGQTPAILQFGSRTTIGAQRTCDANAFRGSLEQLLALTRGDDTMTPEQFLDLLKDPAVRAELKRIPYQYQDPGQPNAHKILLAGDGVLRSLPGQVAQIKAQLDEVATRVGQPISDEQLERVLRKVIGSVDGASPAA